MKYSVDALWSAMAFIYRWVAEQEFSQEFAC
jgi:hypothetical protein